MADPIFAITEKGEVALTLKNADGATMSLADAKTKLNAVVRWSNDGDGSVATAVETNGGNTYLVTPLVEGQLTVTAEVDTFHPFTNAKTTTTGTTLLKFFDAITPSGVRISVVKAAQ
jgi:hypothetical protein